MPTPPVAEAFTVDEISRLAPYFTNVDRHVFALTNLPETVKGALFARYSRSAKSLRRLFLDEFDKDVAGTGGPHHGSAVGTARAEQLYAKVFNDYGDDSVAQLGGAHLACEFASNILTKVLERGRLMAYLEQSTRYVPYTTKLHDRWRYHVPEEIGHGALRQRYVQTMNVAFETYARLIPTMEAYFAARHPKHDSDSAGVHRAAIRAKALDTLRGMLPAATQSNVGLYGSGQAYESLLLRMRAHPLAEVRGCADEMLGELRKVIPSFLVRLDVPERGGRWTEYLKEIREAAETQAERLAPRVVEGLSPHQADEVTLTDFDPDGEVKVVAALLYPGSDLPDVQLQAIARGLSAVERQAVLQSAIGSRTNRRHKPGRAFERTSYRFDILTDYGAFRDLQRHRMLTIDWQGLTPAHGYVEPEAVVEAGVAHDFRQVVEASAELHQAVVSAGWKTTASYAVAMAYRVRFYMEMNAREAMHVIELRTGPQGHPAYRRVCQQMHRLIDQHAGHHALAAAMQFADHSEVALERLASERALERKRSVVAE